MCRAVCIFLVLVAFAMGSARANAQSAPHDRRSPQGTDPFSGVHSALDHSVDAAVANVPSPTVPRGTEGDEVAERRPRGEVASNLGTPSVPANKRSAAIKRLEQLRPLVEPILRSEDVPVELAFLVVVESGGRPEALSKKGARGLWQLMPNTARRYGLVVDGDHDERLDVHKATRAAAQYLRDLHVEFNSWPLALAAYNAGEPAVQKAIDRTGESDFSVLSSQGLLPLETRNYVPAVLRLIDGSGTGTAFNEPPRKHVDEERVVYAMQTSEVAQ